MIGQASVEAPARVTQETSAGFPAPDDSEEAYPSPLIAWYGMFVFFLAQVVATMDRGILAFVAEPVRRDLGATDVQISLLQGLAFAIFYATVGLPLGMIADIVSRRRMLIAGILVWSSATLLTGLSHNFAQMFACRLFVGLGEAALGPCAISMMADLFPPAKRGRPMSIYLLGGTISGGLAIVLTGLFMGLPVETTRHVPLIGGLVPWRLTFLLCGLLGLVNAALLLLLPEIGRRGPLLARRGFGVGAVARYFGQRWRLFLPLYLAAGLWSMGSSSTSAWAVTYMVRHFGASLPFIGQRLGTLNMTAALIGSLLTSVVLTHIIRQHGIKGKLRLTPLLPLMVLPGALIQFAPTIQIALLLAAVPSLALPLYGSTLLSALSDLVPADMRGVSVSVYAFAGTMIGGTFGPLGVALVSDHMLHDPGQLGLAILLIAVPALLVSSLLFQICRRGLT